MRKTIAMLVLAVLANVATAQAQWGWGNNWNQTQQYNNWNTGIQYNNWNAPPAYWYGYRQNIFAPGNNAFWSPPMHTFQAPHHGTMTNHRTNWGAPGYRVQSSTWSW